MLVRRCDGRGHRSVYVRASVAACAFSEKVARLGRADAYFERACRAMPGNLEARQRAGREPRVSAPCRNASSRRRGQPLSQAVRACSIPTSTRRGVASHRARG
ncbi:MAG: hypothetical protein ACLR3C_11060 [Eggerthella lenta]